MKRVCIGMGTFGVLFALFFNIRASLVSMFSVS